MAKSQAEPTQHTPNYASNLSIHRPSHATANDDHSDLINESELAAGESNTFQNSLSKSSDISQHPDIDVLAEQLVMIFNHSPYLKHNAMTMRYEAGEIKGYVDASPTLVGNVPFGILHGGVAATLLDSIGGIVGMLEIYRRGQGTLEEQIKKIGRMATVDLRIDYLAPGRGKQFIATAEIIRMGRKGHTARMLMTDETGKPIAAGIATYAF